MGVTMYGYPKCSTCRNAKKWLDSRGVDTETVDIVQNPPSAEELDRFVERSGLDVNKFFNVSGEVYKEMQLKDKLPHMDRAEKLALLASNGKLIKRPIVTDGTRATVGFKEELFEQNWGGAGSK